MAQFLSLLSVWPVLFEHGAIPKSETGAWLSYQSLRNNAQVLLQSRPPAIDGALAAQWRDAFARMAEDAGAELSTP